MDTGFTFTYDPALPTSRDRVRDQLGDIDVENPIRGDETYDAMLQEYEYDENKVIARMARAFASQFARNPSSVSIPGGPSVSWSDRVANWRQMAKDAEAAVSVTTGIVISEQRQRDGQPTTSEYRRDWSTWYV